MSDYRINQTIDHWVTPTSPVSSTAIFVAIVFFYRLTNLRHSDVGDTKRNASIVSEENSVEEAQDTRQSRNNSVDDDNLNDIIISRSEVVEKRFPWEPIQKIPTTQSTSSAEKRNSEGNLPSGSYDRYNKEIIRRGGEHSAPVGVPDDAQAQLHFLASMTFANGGLRQPSCPCCQ